MHDIDDECSQITTKYGFNEQLYRQGRNDTLSIPQRMTYRGTGLQRHSISAHCTHHSTVASYKTLMTPSLVGMQQIPAYLSLTLRSAATARQAQTGSQVLKARYVRSLIVSSSSPFQRECWMLASADGATAGSWHRQQLLVASTKTLQDLIALLVGSTWA